MEAAQRRGRNPWVSQAMYGQPASAFGEDGVYFSEYQEADAEPPMSCPAGHPASRKPTVGALICPVCGLMRCADGTWRLSPAFQKLEGRAEAAAPEVAFDAGEERV
jgi:hypothetical protein